MKPVHFHKTLIKALKASVISLFLVFLTILPRDVFADEEFVYIVNNGVGSVSVLDANNNLQPIAGSPFTTVVGSSEFLIAINPSGTRAYIPNNSANSVSVMSIAPGTGALAHIAGSPFSDPMHISGPWGVAISPDGTRVYITNETINEVSMYDADFNLLASVSSFGTGPNGVTTGPDGTVYVANNMDAMISRFDADLNHLNTVSSFGMFPHVVAVNPAGTLVYVTNTGDGAISMYTPQLVLMQTVPIGITGVSGPVAIAFDPDGSRIYVANTGTGSTSVLDVNNNLMPLVMPPLSSQGGANSYVTAVNPSGTRLYTTSVGMTPYLSVRELTDGAYTVVPVAPSGLSNLFNSIGIAFTPQAAGIRNLTGQQKKNNFGLVFERFNLLQWEQPSSVGVSGYNVYRDGVKIATLESSTLQYEDHNRKKGVSTLYSVTTFDPDGNESSPISVVVQ